MRKNTTSFLAFGAIAIGLGYVVNDSRFEVPSGHRGLKFSSIEGLSEEVYTEGTHFKIPFIEKIILMDIHCSTHVIQTSIVTKDGYMVDCSVRVMIQPDVQKLRQIYLEIGPNYREILVAPLINEQIRKIGATVNAEDFLRERHMVSSAIQSASNDRFSTWGVRAVDVSLIEVKFPEKFETDHLLDK
jgi:prohibitin 2